MDNYLFGSVKVELVPEIHDSWLNEIASRIQPLLYNRGTHRYHLIENLTKDLRRTAYTWDAKLGQEVGVFNPLNELDIITFHKYGAPALFKPSIAEVIACIDRYVPAIKNPECPIKYWYLLSDNLSAANIIGDCHWCHCKLFGKPANG